MFATETGVTGSISFGVSGSLAAPLTATNTYVNVYRYGDSSLTGRQHVSFDASTVSASATSWDWKVRIMPYSGTTTNATIGNWIYFTNGGQIVQPFGNYGVPLQWDSLPIELPSEKLRRIMAERMSPAIIGKHSALKAARDVREMRARETLRRVIGEQKYQQFLKKGFVTVTNPKSGNVFQIFPAGGITQVYFRGIMTERLCVVLQGDFPPTDSLIMRYLMILNNEEQFRSLAIKHKVYASEKYQSAEKKEKQNLAQIFAKLKKVA